jgi:hypothetical protein
MSIWQVFSPAKVVFVGIGVILLVSVYSLVQDFYDVERF